MNRSNELKEFTAAFLKAQAAMRPAAKDSVNPHFKSKYADLASVIDAVRGPLHECGIVFLQPVRYGERGVEVETVLIHTSGEWVSDTLTVPIPRNDPQSVGSAISYGKRYGLQSLCGVPSEDDDGNAAA